MVLLKEMPSRAAIERPGFDRRMTREEINQCPVRMYEGPTHIIRSRHELTDAAQKLRKEPVLGFDIETRPSFTRGETYSPALLQLAGSKAVYLFQLSRLKFPRLLRELLSNPHIIKAGVATDHDIKKLKELGDFEPAGFVDLGAVARSAGIKNHGLRGLAAVFLGFRISKQAQISNWSRKNLSPTQVAYAATDAWVSRELYLHMQKKGYKVSKYYGD